jgi:Spy/CpxP family protein refolding chaperone
MTATVKHIVLGVGAGILALGVTAGIYVHAQDQNANEPRRPFMGRGIGPGGRGGPFGPMRMLPMLGRQLELTDAQKDQIKGIADSHKADWKTLADRARTAHVAVTQAITGDTIDEALVRQRSSEAAAVDADIAVARARAYAEVVQILTPEQKTKLSAMKAQMQDRGGRKHQ